MPSSVITWLCSYGDRFLIERFIDLKSLGVYSFLSTISSLTEMGFLALGSALQPFIFDFYKLTDKHKIHHLYRLFLLLTACIASSIILAGSNLDLLVQNKGYLEMVKYLPVMTVGYIFSAIIYLFNLQIIYAKKSQYFIFLGIVVLCSNLSLNAFLIPLYGIWGAVISSVLTKLIGALTSLYFANRSYALSFEKGNFLMLLALIVIMLLFWWLGTIHYLSFSISSMLQFIITVSLIIGIYRKLILQSCREMMATIKKRGM
jgi:O-antigen/teichoic acid export membrane protein